MCRILVTGASGFIGSHIVAAALQRGYETWAVVRGTSSRRYLADPRIRFLELNLDDEEALSQQLAGQQFDYVVHAAGVTKCQDNDDFYRVNTRGTEHLVTALLRTQQKLKKFVFLSSLSVCGAVREQQPFTAITVDDIPCPNTHYGRSKLLAEEYLTTVANQLNYTILRPTGVYGPRERDYLLAVKSILTGFDFAIGYGPRVLTYVYVSDVVQAVFLALDQSARGKVYFLTDGEAYDGRAFGEIVAKTLTLKHMLHVTLPRSVARMVCGISDWIGRTTGHVTALNNDKYHLLCQRNYLCDLTPAREELGYTPRVLLAEGLRTTIEWYQHEGWI